MPVRLNGEPVTGTRWLADGDEIGIGSARIRCAVGAATLDFSLGFSGVDYDTLPPEPATAGRGRRRVCAAPGPPSGP